MQIEISVADRQTNPNYRNLLLNQENIKNNFTLEVSINIEQFSVKFVPCKSKKFKYISPYKTGCVSVPKDINNYWTDMVLL